MRSAGSRDKIHWPMSVKDLAGPLSTTGSQPCSRGPGDSSRLHSASACTISQHLPCRDIEISQIRVQVSQQGCAHAHTGPLRCGLQLCSLSLSPPLPVYVFPYVGRCTHMCAGVMEAKSQRWLGLLKLAIAFIFLDRVSHWAQSTLFDWPASPNKGWPYRCLPSPETVGAPFYMDAGIGFRSSGLFSKQCTKWAISPTPVVVLRIFSKLITISHT